MSKNSIKIAKAIAKRDELGVYSIFPQALINKLSNIENISYRNKIFIPKDEKDGNIFDDIHNSLRKLWVERYNLNECFEIFKAYREFEPILFKGSCYRDHFIHQYLVFLTGLPIISRFSANIKSNLSEIHGIIKDLVKVDKSWLLASTYHDISYPVQRFDNWLKAFFIDFLNIETNPVSINMSPILLERSHLSNLRKLTDFSYQLYKKVNPVLEKENLDRLWMENYLERNHGVFSSLILLDKYEINLGPGSEKHSLDIFSSQILPSAMAIALHDPYVWGEEVISHIVFENDPITFLLVYCDTVQEWGRPLTSYSIQQSPYVPLMSDYEVGVKNVSMTLTYDIVEEVRRQDGATSTTFEEKCEEISKLFSKLKSSSVRFEIVLESTDEDFGRKKFVRSSKDN